MRNFVAGEKPDWFLRPHEIPGFDNLPREQQCGFLRLYFAELSKTLAAHESATNAIDREAALETGRVAAETIRADVFEAVRRNDYVPGGMRASLTGIRSERPRFS